jgi:hypothetical protein
MRYLASQGKCPLPPHGHGLVGLVGKKPREVKCLLRRHAQHDRLSVLARSLRYVNLNITGPVDDLSANPNLAPEQELPVVVAHGT